MTPGGQSQRGLAVMKAAQCGISAAGVSLALYAADAWGANVLYVLPFVVLTRIRNLWSLSSTRVIRKTR
jgi:hypothetical protein